MFQSQRFLLALALLVSLAACGDLGQESNKDEKGGKAAAQETPKHTAKQTAKQTAKDTTRSLKDRMKDAMDAAIKALKPYHDQPSGMVGFAPGAPMAPSSGGSWIGW